MAAATLGAGILALSIGPAGIPAEKIIPIILKGGGSIEQSILINIRLPRILLAFAIGGSLSLAGVILQGVFRNALVEPYTLGISAGAGLLVCLNIALGLSEKSGILSLPVSGFIGALLIIVFIYILTAGRKTFKIQNILLTGVMLSFICSSLIMLIMAVSRSEDLHGIIFWIMGSLEEPGWALIYGMFLVSILGLFISYMFCFDLNALSLGEEEAAHLGINIERSKKLLFILACLLTGFSVSIAGIIGFAGLVVPHLVRMLIGRDHRVLLIASFLSGSAFLILSDTLARTIISPMELPVGVITGIIGGSFFVYALGRRKYIF